MKHKQRGFTVVELISVVVGAATVVAFIAAIYVAIHFLAKVW